MALLAGLGGCGGELYGPPATPTPSQQAAIVALTGFARTVERAQLGTADARALLDAHLLVAEASRLSMLRTPPISLTATSFAGFDASCARGTPSRGFVYDDCQVAGGALRGQVLVSAAGVRFELLVPSTEGRGRGYVLQGMVRAVDDRVSGSLEFRTATETLAGDPGGSWTLDSGGPGVSVEILWSASLSSSGLTAGEVEVRVSTGGGQDEALFGFSPGGATVRNSADVR
ncbi:MAG: hypothetical protein Q8S73_17385 [Deltaproteobacteria bacterium]|nr:hypothetical protein [Deltaproteobacteria bacterium]